MLVLVLAEQQGGRLRHTCCLLDHLSEVAWQVMVAAAGCLLAACLGSLAGLGLLGPQGLACSCLQDLVVTCACTLPRCRSQVRLSWVALLLMLTMLCTSRASCHC